MKLQTGGGFLETREPERPRCDWLCRILFSSCQKKLFWAEQDRYKIKVIAHFRFTSNVKSCRQFAVLQTSWPAGTGWGTPRVSAVYCSRWLSEWSCGVALTAAACRLNASLCSRACLSRSESYSISFFFALYAYKPSVIVIRLCNHPSNL